MATRTPKKYLIEDQIIIDEIYPLVDATMSKRTSNLKSCIERFIHKRHDSLYDYAPVDRFTGFAVLLQFLIAPDIASLGI